MAERLPPTSLTGMGTPPTKIQNPRPENRASKQSKPVSGALTHTLPEKWSYRPENLSRAYTRVGRAGTKMTPVTENVKGRYIQCPKCSASCLRSTLHFWLKVEDPNSCLARSDIMSHKMTIKI